MPAAGMAWAVSGEVHEGANDLGACSCVISVIQSVFSPFKLPEWSNQKHSCCLESLS